MYEPLEKTPEKKSQGAANAVPKMQNNHAPTSRFVDNRPEAIQMRKIRDLAKNSPQNAKLRELHHLAAAHSVAQMKSDVKQGFGFVDNRPEAIQMRKLQGIVNKRGENSILQFVTNKAEKIVQKADSDSENEMPKKKMRLDHDNNSKYARNHYKVTDNGKGEERVHDPRTGERVDLLTHPSFKKERMLRYAAMSEGKPLKGRNIHVVRRKKDGEKRGKTFIAASRPAGVDSGTPHHSEFFTKKMSNAQAPLPEYEQVYDATTRENCEKCRFDYPSDKPENQVFGRYYPGNEDFMTEEDRGESIKGAFPKRTKRLPEKERIARKRTREQAQSERQHQNGLLAKDLEKLHKDPRIENEAAHSSDDDSVILDNDLKDYEDSLKKIYRNTRTNGERY